MIYIHFPHLPFTYFTIHLLHKSSTLSVTVNGANSNHYLLITDTARTSHFTLQQFPFIIHVRELL